MAEPVQCPEGIETPHDAHEAFGGFGCPGIPKQHQLRIRVKGDKVELTVVGQPLPPGRYIGTAIRTGEAS